MKLAHRNPATRILETFVEAYNNRRLADVINLFSTQHKVLLIGTGIDEIRRNLDEIKLQVERDWIQSESNILTRTSEYIWSDEPCCWADATYKSTFVIDGQTYTAENLRGSIYCVKESRDWKITHMHASFPHLADNEASSFPTQMVLKA